MLFSYDDKGVLYLMTFYNKNLILIECNYQIYDKNFRYHSIFETLMIEIEIY